MTCLLAEGYNLRASYLSRALKRILKRGMSVAVIAFSFRESAVRSAEDFQRLWGEGSKNHTGIVSGLTAYGIAPEDISFLNYFTDTKESAAALLRSADVLYFPGGVPDQMTERIREFALEEIIRAHKGVFIGYSAGALALLSEYHLSPDRDYPVFRYGKGLGIADGFYLEPHYDASPEQLQAVRRVQAERGM
ncbi:MAG: Type 1 glutamine amidotransferase-like domain-containing protein, partial [Clostridia bacterium]|nr:Type 1 glutamine amidotransferase-like domain-containing protein [Clostridia bacterium]